MSTVNALVKSALDYAYAQDPNFLYYLGRANVEQQLQTALETVIPNEMTLSSTKPDFEAILLALVQKLQEDNVWKDVLHAGTGQTLLRNISSGITYLNFALIRATQNSMLHENASKNAVYQGMNFLGVDIRRKVPKRIKARLTIPDHNSPYSIERFTQFSIANVDYFNRERITYTEFDMTKDVILYQGTVYRQEGTAAGIPFETIDIGYENFAISDEDVYVAVDGVFWTRDPSLKPWMAKKDQEIFFTRTQETGNVQIRFGNKIFGKIPAQSSTIEIVWAETLGSESELVNSDVNFSNNEGSLNVSGITLSASYGGDNELDTKFYATMGPRIRATNGKGVNRPSYMSLALEYPRVRDALIRGQAELAPGKRNWMNIVSITALTENGVPMDTAEWNEFVTFINDNSVYQLEYIRADPIIIEVDVAANVFCTTSANLGEIEARLSNEILDYTKPRRGAIGYSVFKSDASGILEGKLKDRDKKTNKITVTDYSKLVEYSTGLTFTYSAGFNPSVLPEGTGIDEEGNVIADFICYIKIKNVNLDVKYTPRRTYAGRNDLRIGL